MGRRGYAFIVLFFFWLGFLPIGHCDQDAAGRSNWLPSEVGLFSGYGWGELGLRKDQEVIPLGLRLGFDLRPLTRRIGWEPTGLLELVIEPYLGVNIRPSGTMEFGLPFFWKYGFPLTERLYPFLELGTGPYYMTCDSNNQSTQFNFISQGGAGLLYFLERDWGVNAGFRYRHVSNGALKKPNGGINTLVFLAGFSFFF